MNALFDEDGHRWAEWLRFRDAFAALLDARFYTIEWLDGEIWSGRLRLFTHGDSAILTGLKTYPTGTLELTGQAAVGNLETIRSKLIPLSISWAKSIGCTVAVIESREGWARVMKQDGFELYQTALRKFI